MLLKGEGAGSTGILPCLAVPPQTSACNTAHFPLEVETTKGCRQSRADCDYVCFGSACDHS